MCGVRRVGQANRRQLVVHHRVANQLEPALAPVGGDRGLGIVPSDALVLDQEPLLLRSPFLCGGGMRRVSLGRCDSDPGESVALSVGLVLVWFRDSEGCARLLFAAE